MAEVIGVDAAFFEETFEADGVIEFLEGADLDGVPHLVELVSLGSRGLFLEEGCDGVFVRPGCGWWRGRATCRQEGTGASQNQDKRSQQGWSPEMSWM